MKTRQGFTILELMLTLVLISAVAAAAVLMHFGRSDVTLEKASVLLAQDLRAAQNRSAYLAQASQFRFLPEGDGYEVRDENGTLVRNPRTGRSFVRRYSTDGVFRGVTVVSVQFGSDDALLFDERGLALEEGQLRLAFGGDNRLLRVEKGSGKVTIVGSTSGWRDFGN